MVFVLIKDGAQISGNGFALGGGRRTIIFALEARRKSPGQSSNKTLKFAINH